MDDDDDMTIEQLYQRARHALGYSVEGPAPALLRHYCEAPALLPRHNSIDVRAPGDPVALG